MALELAPVRRPVLRRLVGPVLLLVLGLVEPAAFLARLELALAFRSAELD